MTQTAKTYGGALYDLSLEEQLTETLLPQIKTVQQEFQDNPEFAVLLSTPSIPKKERCAVLDTCFSTAIHPYLLNFMKILCENGTIAQMPQCIREFVRRYQQDNGILEVLAITAVPLGQTLQDRLKDKLQRVTGKTILLQNKVDASCLGGVRLLMGDTQLDGTVAGNLSALKKELQNLVL